MKNNKKINKNQKPSKPYKKPEVKTYSKKMDSFVDAIEELRNTYPFFNDILNFAEGEEITPKTASEKMLEEFDTNFPSVTDHRNQLYAINISSTRCILKTDKRVSFGWKFKYQYNNETETCDIYDVTLTVTTFGDVDLLTQVLDKNKWECESIS